MTLTTKQCSQCLKRRPLDQFSWKLRGVRRTNRCHSCRRENYHENPIAARKRAVEHHWKNRESILNKMRQRRINNPLVYMLGAAKSRAKKEGVPFDLDPGDLTMPKRCPVLGVELEMGNGKCLPCSPTLDKIIPSLGYVRGNVLIVSLRANTIKNDATVLEIEAVARFYRALAVTCYDNPRLMGEEAKRVLDEGREG